MTSLLSDQENQIDPEPQDNDVIEEPELPSAMPTLIESNGLQSPAVANEIKDTGIEVNLVIELSLKLANSVPNLTTPWAAQQLCLPMQLIDEVFWQLKDDKLVEILGQLGPFSYQYAITQRGREHAKRLLEISGYVGPAPVSLETYTAMLMWQIAQREPVTQDEVRESIKDLVLPAHAVQVAELAVSSGRSLFLFGPAGNGKTSLGLMLHNAIKGDLWIPHCISVGSTIIRMFDRQCHQKSGFVPDEPGKIDQRWVHIKRPFVIVGGEMTIETLDLSFSEALRFYEAPMHMKANGGTYLIDDFGRQRMDPAELLNRWIIPLERRIDHLTLHTGQKIDVPFELMLFVATNLTVEAVADPAFLRRMGYRLHVNKPTAEDYCKIFQNYASKFDVSVDSEFFTGLLARYKEDGRELRCSEARDLIERISDACKLRHEPFRIDDELMDIAWSSYFGNQ